MEAFLSVILHNILPFLIVLTVLVFVHELGHYLAAIKNGVKVDVFSIGFGPEIFGWTDGRGTRWRFSLVPLGGYVKMFSDLNAASQPDPEAMARMTEEEKAYSLAHKSVGQRMAVSFAGPFANYVLAVFLLTLQFSQGTKLVPSAESKIGGVQEGSAAYRGGLRSQDIVTHIDGHAIASFARLRDYVSSHPGVPVVMDVTRGKAQLKLTVIPEKKIISGQEVGFLGMAQGFDAVHVSWYQAPLEAIKTCYELSALTLSSLWRVLTRQASADGLSGPIGIASMIGKAAQAGWLELCWFAACLSISLGLINLLPVPMLDGGHLLFYTIEAIKGSPVTEKVQEMAYRVGFALVLSLMVFSTWNDLSRLKVFSWLKHLF